MREAGKTGVWKRERAGMALAAAVLLLTPPAAWSSVTVADPRSFPHAAQNARITVLFDGKPLAGATVKVEKYLSWDAVVTLLTDREGRTVLPELPDGFYQIVAWSNLYPGIGGGFDFCIGPCRDAFEIVDLTMNSLDGEITTVDAPAAISEFPMEVGPFPFPPRADLLATADAHPNVRSLLELRGVVRDPTGALIRDARIEVVRKATQGGDKVALLRSDAEGKFAARLPDGKYVVLIAAGGFQTRAIPLAISPSGDTNGLQVVLKIEAPTE